MTIAAVVGISRCMILLRPRDVVVPTCNVQKFRPWTLFHASLCFIKGKTKKEKCFPGPEAAEPLWNIFPTLIDLYPWFLKYCNQLNDHCEQKSLKEEFFEAMFLFFGDSHLREGGEVATDESEPGF